MINLNPKDGEVLTLSVLEKMLIGLNRKVEIPENMVELLDEYMSAYAEHCAMNPEVFKREKVLRKERNKVIPNNVIEVDFSS